MRSALLSKRRPPPKLAGATRAVPVKRGRSLGPCARSLGPRSALSRPRAPNRGGTSPRSLHSRGLGPWPPARRGRGRRGRARAGPRAGGRGGRARRLGLEDSSVGGDEWQRDWHREAVRDAGTRKGKAQRLTFHHTETIRKKSLWLTQRLQSVTCTGA